ncbi:MAG: EVE domain-containing protein [Alphaproteobacteria bacterium]|nr:EVE domain-containing protein [Alphaproteobacteria bacterium]
MARCWLMKSEPDTYAIDDLARDGTTLWDGVRNYQARNYMRDDMKVGDRVLFYHSSATPPGVAGLAEISADATPDATALDPDDDHYDPKATDADPRWVVVELRHVETFPEVVPLATLKADPALAGMLVIQRGQRLSVQPVEPAHFDRVVALARGR